MHSYSLRKLRSSLLSWFARSGRNMPWRHTRDPYRVLTAVIMLQQTQVSTVIPYFHKFMNCFPSLLKLAASPRQTVLKQWAGLGYYRRAINLWKSARIIRSKHRGRFPRNIAEIRKLPGCGPYTTATVASMAFNLPETAVDGNIIRVISRLYALKGDPSKKTLRNKIALLASQLLDRKYPGDFNQAMMELGGRICTPRSPACPVCPIRIFCSAQKKGLQEQLPQLPGRPFVEKLDRAVSVLLQNNKIYIEPKKPAKGFGLMEGMWGFPGFAVKHDARSSLSDLHAVTGLDPVKVLCQFTHSITRYRIRVRAFLFMAKKIKGHKTGKWVRIGELEKYPMPSADQKIAASLKIPSLNS